MRRFAFLFSCIIGGLLAAYYAQPYADGNSDAVMIVITVITVFAGFLIAIIAVIGDPAMIPEGSWRIAEGGRTKIEQQLVKHTVLFIFYLITIGLLFVGVILSKAFEGESEWKVWIERAYLFCGVTSFLLTFALPFSLFRMQRDRYDKETERRRAAAASEEPGRKPRKDS